MRGPEYRASKFVVESHIVDRGGIPLGGWGQGGGGGG
ncbi:MAG: hypothetical protein PWR16_1455, partial [Methanoculleus sp.]|nr:hypothetical protein [Methanoculleus sp.]